MFRHSCFRIHPSRFALRFSGFNFQPFNIQYHSSLYTIHAFLFHFKSILQIYLAVSFLFCISKFSIETSLFHISHHASLLKIIHKFYKFLLLIFYPKFCIQRFISIFIILSYLFYSKLNLRMLLLALRFPSSWYGNLLSAFHHLFETFKSIFVKDSLCSWSYGEVLGRRILLCVALEFMVACLARTCKTDHTLERATLF